jgi:hypothetical protein
MNLFVDVCQLNSWITLKSQFEGTLNGLSLKDFSEKQLEELVAAKHKDLTSTTHYQRLCNEIRTLLINTTRTKNENTKEKNMVGS